MNNQLVYYTPIWYIRHNKYNITYCWIKTKFQTIIYHLPDSIFNAELYTFGNMFFFVLYLTRKKNKKLFRTKNLTASHLLIITLTFNRFYIRHVHHR